MDYASLKEALKDTPVSEIRAFDEIGSTNDEALRWLAAGAPDFALVIADLQISGRGRYARKWITLPGASLAFTLILRPTAVEMNSSPALFSPLCGLAVWQALHDAYGLSPQIKWPNDVMLDCQKCCGILAEADWSGATLNGIAAGIGINITEASIPSSAAMVFPPTWIEKYTNEKIERFDLLARVLNAIGYWRPRIGSAEFFTVWQQNLAFRGEQVRIEQAGAPVQIGEETGIDAGGNLLLRDASGATITVEVGDVHLRTAKKD
jgi:BirA family biotin operon repressor/biotin-[acetyl-CoA-carboxylase] ligase